MTLPWPLLDAAGVKHGTDFPDGVYGDVEEWFKAFEDGIFARHWEWRMAKLEEEIKQINQMIDHEYGLGGIDAR